MLVQAANLHRCVRHGLCQYPADQPGGDAQGPVHGGSCRGKVDAVTLSALGQQIDRIVLTGIGLGVNVIYGAVPYKFCHEGDALQHIVAFQSVFLRNIQQRIPGALRQRQIAAIDKLAVGQLRVPQRRRQGQAAVAALVDHACQGILVAAAVCIGVAVKVHCGVVGEVQQAAAGSDQFNADLLRLCHATVFHRPGGKIGDGAAGIFRRCAPACAGVAAVGAVAQIDMPVAPGGYPHQHVLKLILIRDGCHVQPARAVTPAVIFPVGDTAVVIGRKNIYRQNFPVDLTEGGCQPVGKRLGQLQQAPILPVIIIAGRPFESQQAAEHKRHRQDQHEEAAAQVAVPLKKPPRAQQQNRKKTETEHDPSRNIAADQQTQERHRGAHQHTEKYPFLPGVKGQPQQRGHHQPQNQQGLGVALHLGDQGEVLIAAEAKIIRDGDSVQNIVELGG